MSEPLPGVAEAEAIKISDDGTKVKDLMHRGIISCAPSDTVGQVAKVMVDNEIHAVVVMDGGKAVGVVSQTDMVLARQGRTSEQARAMKAADIMTPGCATCDANILLSEATVSYTHLSTRKTLVWRRARPYRN